MSKKVILFGLAFGSVSGAALFLYFSKELYLSGTTSGSLFSFLAFLLATAVGVTLCVISLNRDSNKTATLPQLIFAGLLTGTLICAVTSIVHSYVLEAYPSWIDKYVSFQENIWKKRYAATDMTPEEIQSQLEGLRNNFYSKFTFFVSQFSVAASLSLLSSAITGYILVKRRK